MGGVLEDEPEDGQGEESIKGTAGGTVGVVKHVGGVAKI